MIKLLAAHVLEIVTLSRAEAYSRFPREAEACNLTGLCNKWGCTTVQCLVMEANSIAVAQDIVRLSAGNQGILRQINNTKSLRKTILHGLKLFKRWNLFEAPTH